MIRVPASKPRATRQQREAAEQAALFEWARAQAHVLPGIRLMFAIPNGAYLQGGTAQRAAQWAKLRKQGARPGVHDVMLPVPRGEYHGLWLEMKAPRPHHAEVSAEQQAWLVDMLAQGYQAHVCYGWIDAVAKINLYYGREK